MLSATPATLPKANHRQGRRAAHCCSRKNHAGQSVRDPPTTYYPDDEKNARKTNSYQQGHTMQQTTPVKRSTAPFILQPPHNTAFLATVPLLPPSKQTTTTTPQHRTAPRATPLHTSSPQSKVTPRRRRPGPGERSGSGSLFPPKTWPPLLPPWLTRHQWWRSR